MNTEPGQNDVVTFQSLEHQLNELIETANDLQNMSDEIRGKIMGYVQEGSEDGIKKASEPEGYLESLNNQMNDLRWRLSEISTNLDKLRSRV